MAECPKCGKEITKPGARFCSSCGAQLVQTAEAETAATVEVVKAPGEMIKPVSLPGVKIEWTWKTYVKLLVILLLLGGVAGYRYYLAWQANPVSQLNRFVSALKEGNTEKMYSCLCTKDELLLTEKNFEKFVSAEWGRAKEVQIVTSVEALKRTAELPDVQQIPVQLMVESTTGSKYLDLNLKKVSQDGRDCWQVDVNNIHEKYDLSIPPNMYGKVVVSVNGKPVQVDPKSKIAELTAFKGVPFTVKIEGSDIKTLTLNLPQDRDKLYALKLEPPDSLKKKLIGIVTRAIKGEARAYQYYDLSTVEKYADPQGDYLISISHNVDDLKAWNETKTISFSNLEPLEVFYVNHNESDNRLQVQVTMHVVYIEKTPSYLWGELINNCDERYGYILVKQADNSWKITHSVRLY